MNEKKLIALTGGIGSGKSTALKILKDLGFNTLSSDQIVTELYEKEQVRRLLKPLFPDAVTGENFTLDRKKIAEQAFSNTRKHAHLTDLITPMVMAEIIKRTSDDQVYFVEVPLLFECEFADLFDAVLIIVRDKEHRIRSVIERSNLSREQIISRMNMQFDYDNADLSTYTLVGNDGDENELRNKLIDFTKTL